MGKAGKAISLDKTMKKFDLNIEKVLEDWEIFDALREVIPQLS